MTTTLVDGSPAEEFEGACGPDAAKAYYEAKRQALLAGTQVLWPALEDYYDLMVMREQEGKASFMAEKQNQPLDPAQCVFQEQNFHYWDDDYSDAWCRRSSGTNPRHAFHSQ